METWPIWQCLKPEQLVKLTIFQWKKYGTKLDLLIKSEIESLESLNEIDHIMKIPTKWSKYPPC